jgi:hypothetical protein
MVIQNRPSKVAAVALDSRGGNARPGLVTPDVRLDDAEFGQAALEMRRGQARRGGLAPGIVDGFAEAGQGLAEFRNGSSRSEDAMVAVGFSPRWGGGLVRVAERRLTTLTTPSGVATRRGTAPTGHRGLKPTATIAWSLRDRGSEDLLPRGAGDISFTSDGFRSPAFSIP